MAQPEPMQKACHIGAMHNDTAPGQVQAQLIQCKLAILIQALAYPVAMCIQLAATHMTLPSRRERSGLPLQDHQIVHKTRRHAEVPCRFTMAMTILDKRNDTTTQRDRM